MSMNSMMDAMQVLKVPRNADFLQIKQAYRQAALRYHPDSALGSSNAEKFQKVTEAFQYLRKAFDAPSSRKNHSNPDFFANHDRNQEEVTQAVELSLEELINCVEFSPDEHVRQVALETIASRRECLGFQYLQGLLSRNGFEAKMEVIRALGQPGLEPAREMLIPLVGCKDLMVSAAAIRSLERICLSNRTKIIESLNRELSGSKRFFLNTFQKIKNFLIGNPPSQGKLGDLLIRT
ncbi:MAG: DnaJ domain-containing protein, partial [SAR324 cluster bacterium]|nr:DnaJ domain-containing protein [SAR324 cluster bacterium]